MKKLSDRGVVPIALGDKDRWTGSLWYMYLADRITGTENLANAIKGTASFTDPGLIQAAKQIQDLVGMNAFSKGFNGLSNDEAKAQFMDSQAAMYLMGTWELPNYTTSTAVPQSFRDSMGFFKFPAVAGGKGNVDSWVGGPGVGLFVAENSPVKEEAKKFVQYFVKRWGEESVNGAGVIPATKVDTSKNPAAAALRGSAQGSEQGDELHAVCRRPDAERRRRGPSEPDSSVVRQRDYPGRFRQSE